MLTHFKRAISIFLTTLLVTVFLFFPSPQPAFASGIFAAPLCIAYSVSATGKAIEEGIESTVTVSKAVTSAGMAGAGALTGYAGIASAVSQLGLGSLTTAIAGMMGSNVAGAAATAVVTSAVGGPIVMGGIIVVGTAGVAFLTHSAKKFLLDSLGGVAERYCSSN